MGSPSNRIAQHPLTAVLLGLAVLAAAAAGFGVFRDTAGDDARRHAALGAQDAHASAAWEAPLLRPPRDVERDHWTPRKAAPPTTTRRRRRFWQPAPRPPVEPPATFDDPDAAQAPAPLPARRVEPPSPAAEPEVVRATLPRVDWDWEWLRVGAAPVAARGTDLRTDSGTHSVAQAQLPVREDGTPHGAAPSRPAPSAPAPDPQPGPAVSSAPPVSSVASLFPAPAPLPARTDALSSLPRFAAPPPTLAKAVPAVSDLRLSAPRVRPPATERATPATISVAPAVKSLSTAPTPARRVAPVRATPAPPSAAPSAKPPTPDPTPRSVTPASPRPAVAPVPRGHAGRPDFVLRKARDLEDLELPAVGGIEVGARGALGGSGSVHGPLVVAGVFAPGHSPGRVEVEGDFALEPDAVLEIELAGTDPEDFDRILVEGTVTLSGVVRVLLLDGFVPGPGDTFDVILAQAIHDAGAVFELPDLGPGLLMQLSTATTDAGQALVLSSLIRLGAAGAAVPEPGSALLLAAALAAFALRRRVRR